MPSTVVPAGSTDRFREQPGPPVLKAMYGLVNKAIKDLVISSAGEKAWSRVKIDAGVEGLKLLDTSNYPDDITYRLVASASAVLDLPPDEILHAFGRHWVLYTGRQGWAYLFDAAGDGMIEFLRNLDEMHARIATVMPEGRMPGFTLLETGDDFVLEYRSEREGFAPMVLGILDGLAEQFGEFWSVRHVDRREDQGLDRFHLGRLTDSRSGDVSDAA